MDSAQASKKPNQFEYFDPTPEEQVIVLVESATLRRAERFIEFFLRTKVVFVHLFRIEGMKRGSAAKRNQFRLR
jgi:hypothetical protein